MKILICTIIRNQEHNLNFWYNQLKEIVTNNPHIEFFLSVYENNSTDKTKEILNSYDFNFFSKKKIVSEDLNDIPFFKGGYAPYGEESRQRVKLLSECRNKTFDVDFIENTDFVLFVEPDVRYDTKIFKEILEFSVDNNYDVVSGISFIHGEHYDKWGSRINQSDTWCDLTGYVNTKNKLDVYSTFNCFVLYRTYAIVKENCKFKYLSDFLGHHDCDTVLICEEFRKKGFNKICILPDKVVTHYF